ncbi:MAG TPA: ATP-binding protein [Stenomitos sp.]
MAVSHTASIPDPPQRTLLIVDDCAEDRHIYRRYLAKDPQQSYRIVEASSAQQGLKLCELEDCDVVLLDFRLPDMDGLECLEQLLQHATKPPLSVIMLTGQGDEAIAVQAIKSGAQDYLVKTALKAEVLQLAVRNALRQSYLQGQLNKTLERQRLIATTALQIRQSLDLNEILRTATVELRRLLRCDRIVVYQFAPNLTGKIVAESVAQGWTAILGTTITETFLQQSGQVPLQTTPQKITNVSDSSLSDCHRQLLIGFGVQANLTVPIVLNSQPGDSAKLWGLLVAHQCSAPRQWQDDEADLFSELAVHLAIAIQQAEFLAQTQAALVREKELNLFKSQIIATVSHEYRTPLASILAAASTLENHQHQLQESQREKFLQLIQQKARQLSSLVDDMLLFKQLELDKTEIAFQPLNLLHFFDTLIQKQQDIAGNRYQITYRILGNTEDFWGNRGLLHQIFVNLISNAVKYSPNGGPIECCLVEQETHLMISVRDEGIGIPPQDQHKLFQAFTRGGNVENIAGTGLGLAIVKACVELHDGTIALESELGQGTKVILTLPKRSTAYPSVHLSQ